MLQIFKTIKIVILICFVIVTKVHANDLLYQHIIKTNKIVLEQKEIPKLDSSKLILPLNYFKEKKYGNTHIQILKIKESDSNIWNLILLIGITFTTAVFRYLFIGETKSLFSEIFSFKTKESEVNSIVNFLFNIVFLSFNTYFLYLLLKQYFPEYNNVLHFLVYIPIIFLLKHFILWIIFNLFDLNSLFIKNYKIISKINVAFTVFLMPFFFLLSISNKKHFSFMVTVIAVILLMTLIIKVVKIIVNNLTYITHHFLYFTIYLVAFELIPIILPYIFINNYIKQ